MARPYSAALIPVSVAFETVSSNPNTNIAKSLRFLQVKVQQKRAEADSVAPYSRSFKRTLVGTLFSASGGLGLVPVTPALTL